MNYHLVYQPYTVGDILMMYLHPTLKPTSHETVGKMVKIYHVDQLIGVNFLQASTLFKNLPTGLIIKPSKDLLNGINHLLHKENLPTLASRPSGFYVCQIESKKNHPDSELLYVCQVHLGPKPDGTPWKLTIVTNSTKVKEQDYVVVAVAGTMLFDGTYLTPTVFKGITSEGMFCSAQTLKATHIQQEGVYVIEKSQPLGQDYFGVQHE